MVAWPPSSFAFSAAFSTRAARMPLGMAVGSPPVTRAVSVMPSALCVAFCALLVATAPANAFSSVDIAASAAFWSAIAFSSGAWASAMAAAITAFAFAASIPAFSFAASSAAMRSASVMVLLRVCARAR